MTNWAAHRRTRLGVAYIPEGRAIFPHLSVLENLRVRLRYAVPPGERAAALDRALTAFPVLAERRRQPAGTLSGGEHQMLAWRVVAAPPRLIIADEMSLGLAPMVVELRLRRASPGPAGGRRSKLLVEQYVQRALRFADTAVILRRGHVVWQGPTSAAEDELVAGYLGGTALTRRREPRQVGSRRS